MHVKTVVRFNAYQISASIDAKNNGFTRELRCPPVLIYFTQACREAGVRLVQVTLKDWTLNLVVRFNAYQISASIDAKNNGFTRELRCPPVLIYFTQACREAGVRLVQVTLKDWTLNAFRRNASSAGSSLLRLPVPASLQPLDKPV